MLTPVKYSGGEEGLIRGSSKETKNNLVIFTSHIT
jgi:hypothetical protein